jgi:hypothetical protein
LQHDGFLREEGDSSQGSVEGINEIPHLDISSEDIEHDLVAKFSNGVRYRVSATDADDISAMKKGTYLLSSTIEGETSSLNLEIEHEALNEPFIEATRLLNSVVNSIKAYFEEGQQRRGLRDAFQRPSPVLFTPIDAPNPAWYFWAVVLDPDDAKKNQYCAEAFKINDRVVWQEDIIRGMNTALSKLDAAVDRLDQEVSKYSRKKNEISKLAETLTKVREWMAKAKQQKAAVQKMNRTYPEDPIKKVFYPSFVNSLASRPEWQQYASQVSETGTLIVKAKSLTVEFVEPKDNAVIIRFVNCSITISAEGLNHPKDSVSNAVKPKGRLLWIGNYLAAIIPAKVDLFRVTGYLRVLSKESGDANKNKIPLEDMEDDVVELC